MSLTLHEVRSGLSTRERPSLGLLALAQYLAEKGVEARSDLVPERGVADSPSTGAVEHYLAHGAEGSDGLVGFSATSEFLPQTLLLASVAKRLTGDFIVLGGVGPSILAREIVQRYPFVDAVCVGEGERTLLELASARRSPRALTRIPGLVFRSPEGAVVQNPARPRVASLDVLPVVHHVRKLEKSCLGCDRIAYFATSRGCPGSCTFCSHRALWGGVRSVLSMERLCDCLLEKGLHGERTLLAFQDDTFIDPPRRLTSLQRALKDRRIGIRWASFARVRDIAPDTPSLLKDTGCDEIALGVDGFSPEVLRGMRKPHGPQEAKAAIQALLDKGISVRVNLMWDWPGETYADFEKMTHFAYESICLGATVALSRLIVYPRTALHAKVRHSMRADSCAAFRLARTLGDAAPFVWQAPHLFPNFLQHGYSEDADKKFGLLGQTAYLFAGDSMRTWRHPVRWADRHRYGG